MKVKIIKEYRDTTKNKRLMTVGTELTVSDERGKVLIKAGVAEEVKPVKKVEKTVEKTAEKPVEETEKE